MLRGHLAEADRRRTYWEEGAILDSSGASLVRQHHVHALPQHVLDLSDRIGVSDEILDFLRARLRLDRRPVAHVSGRLTLGAELTLHLDMRARFFASR